MFIMVSGLFADNQPGGRKMTKLLHCVKNKTLPPTSSYSPQTAFTVCFVLALCFAPPCQHIDKVMGWDFIGSKKNLSYCLSQALKWTQSNHLGLSLISLTFKTFCRWHLITPCCRLSRKTAAVMFSYGKVFGASVWKVDRASEFTIKTSTIWKHFPWTRGLW